MEEKKLTNMDLGQLQVQEREFVILCILCASVDYCGRVFCVKLLQKPLGMLTHLWLSFLTASFCWPSFPWTAISCQLVSSAFCCQMRLSIFLCQLTLCLLWDLPFLIHFRSHGRSGPQSFVWVSCQSRQKDSLTGVHTHTPNTTHGHIVSH